MTILAETLAQINTKAWDTLPAELLHRLAVEDIRSAKDWRRLSRARRRSFFGITARMVAIIDRAAQR